MSTVNVTRAFALLALMSISIAANSSDNKWVGTWAMAPEGAGNGFGFTLPPPPAEPLLGKTLRQVVNTSVGGNRVRVRLSNVDGAQPLTISAARVALQDVGADILPESNTALNFGGNPSITIPAGQSIWSDPAELAIPGLARVAVSIYVDQTATDPASPVTFNQYGLQTTYTTTGDETDTTLFPLDETPREAVYWLTGIDVYAKKGTQVIAFIGDSLTDGFDASRVGSKNPFPSELAQRLADRPGANPNSNQQWGLLNVGISGNQVTRSDLNVGAQDRFDRDVLGQSGVTHVFIFEGINDLGVPPLFALQDIPAQAVIDGLTNLSNRARAAGLKVIGATLTPFQGFTLAIAGPYFTEAGEAKRQIINDWIRNGGAYDAVIDFEATVQDPTAPTFILQEFNSDGLHFNEAGYAAVGGAIPLKLLTTSRTLKGK